jgi:hypothetical protein
MQRVWVCVCVCGRSTSNAKLIISFRSLTKAFGYTTGDWIARDEELFRVTEENYDKPIKACSEAIRTAKPVFIHGPMLCLLLFTEDWGPAFQALAQTLASVRGSDWRKHVIAVVLVGQEVK